MTPSKDPRDVWAGSFGERYTDRNREETVADVNREYEDRFGVSMLELLMRFLGDVDRDARILEIGSNVGVQLECLRELGFSNLYGIDVQWDALEHARRHRPELTIVEADGRAIPFETDAFDLVFTVGVLVHVPPDRIDDVVDEMRRVTSRWIFGCEYYAPEYTEALYRGERGVFWKADFPSRFAERRDVEVVERELLEYSGDDGYTVADQFRVAYLAAADRAG